MSTELMGSKKRVTLAEVAKEAGVSVQTASHVMAGNMTVRLPASTRTRVKDAAEKVGYRPNRVAQAMKRGKTNVVAVWMALDRPSPTYIDMLKAVGEKAKAAGYDVMIVGLDSQLAYAGEGRLPNTWPVDGVIAIDAGKSIIKFRADATNDDTPVAVLGFEQYANSDSVVWSVRDSVYETVARMIKAGRRDIVHISPDWVVKDYPREQRRRGYSEAMIDAGLEPVIVATSSETGYAAEQAMAERPTPEAVFGFSDQLAIGAARALLDRGVQIPDDCWIVGCGDFPESADFKVPLTTLRIPVSQIIGQAWDWLAERMEGKASEGRFCLLPMELVQRSSTGTF